MKNTEGSLMGHGVNSASRFLDENVKTVRNVPYILAGIGLALIARQRAWFHKFRAVKNIPQRLISANFVMNGKLTKVAKDLTLYVEHIPKIKVPLPWRKANENGLLIRLVGIKVPEDYQSSVHSYLKDFQNHNIKFQILSRGSHQLAEHEFVKLGVMKPLGSSHNKGGRSDIVSAETKRRSDMESENVLHCLVWTRPQKWSIRRHYFNFELLKIGFAQAQPLPSRVKKSSTKLSEKLHKNERIAIKKGVGIWHGPSNFDILVTSIKEKPNEILDQGKSAARSVYKFSRLDSIINLFSRFRKKSNKE